MHCRVARSFATVISLCLALAVVSTTAFAQDLPLRRQVMTELSRMQIDDLRAWLRNRSQAGTTVPQFGFKVPAEGNTRIRCSLGPAGLRCVGELEFNQCPSIVTVELPNGASTQADVNCTGPNQDGFCDCEFVGG